MIALVSLAGLVTAGCVTRVETAPASGFDVSDYTSFAFQPDELRDAGEEGDLAAALRHAVQSELMAKGFVPAPSDKADLLVACLVNVGNPTGAGRAPGYSDARWRMTHMALDEPGPPDAQDAWEVGAFDLPGGYIGVAVVVDVVDSEANELIWRGWARRRAEPRDVELDEISEVTRAVLAEFPSRASS